MIGTRKKWEVGSCGQKGEKGFTSNVLVIQRLEKQSFTIRWGGL